jgi:hypothetical protein
MATGEGQAEVAIETDALWTFARHDYGPQLGSIPSLATTAYSSVQDPATQDYRQLGPSAQSQAGMMDEGQALFQAESVARNQLATFLTLVGQGMKGYTVAVAGIARLYDETENRVLTRFQELFPQDKNLPEQDPRFAEAVMNEE